MIYEILSKLDGKTPFNLVSAQSKNSLKVYKAKNNNSTALTMTQNVGYKKPDLNTSPKLKVE